MKLTDKTNLAGPVQVDEVNWRILQVGIFISWNHICNICNVSIFNICQLKKGNIVH